MTTQIMFEIPAMYAEAVKSGALVQIGGLLKSTSTGQIVTHLQESGLAHQLISKAALGVGSPVTLIASEGINLGTGVYTAVQVNKLKSMVATLQSLQISTLGISLVGIGVSVAGFAYMHQRFNSLGKRVDELIDVVRAGFQEQQKASIRAHMSRVSGLVLQAKQAFSLSRPDREYSRISEALADEAAYFRGELEFLCSPQNNINLELFWQLTQILMLCNSIRIDCRMRTNELLNAQIIAEGVASEYQKLFEPITPVSFDATEQEGSLATTTVKDITDSAASKPYLIDHLRTRYIDGRDYIRRIEAEEEQPLLMLPAA